MNIINYISEGNNLEEFEFDIDDNIEYIEYSLVYGRYKSLEFLLNKKFYQDELNKDNYNPFDLNNCDPDVSNDINNGSWWGNDEWERRIKNKKTINHEKCFEILKKYNKGLDMNNFLKWYKLFNSCRYYNGSYFADVNLLVKEIFEKEELNISNFIKKFESLLDTEILIKIITKIFKSEEILNKLR